MITSNSSPVITLGAVGKLNLLQKCFKEVIIPLAVMEEILQKKDNPESLAVQKARGEGWLKVETIQIHPLLKVGMLGRGEVEAISLAVKHKSLLLIDDDMAKNYGGILGVEAHGTLFVLSLAQKKSLLDRTEVILLLQRMIERGFYISTEVYAEFVKSL